MKIPFSLGSLVVLSAGTALARSIRRQNQDCAIESTYEVYRFIDRFVSVLEGVGSDLGSPTSTAEAILDESFLVYSDSQASTQGITLEANYPYPIYNKSDYLNADAVHKEFEGVNIQTMDVVADCNHIVWRWEFSQNGYGKYPLRGFHMFYMLRDGVVGLKAAFVMVEFNSIAGLLDGGGGVLYPNGTMIMPPQEE